MSLSPPKYLIRHSPLLTASEEGPPLIRDGSAFSASSRSSASSLAVQLKRGSDLADMTDVQGNGTAADVEKKEEAPNTGGQDGPVYNFDRRGSKYRVSIFFISF